MRFFPRTARRRLAAAAVTCALATCVLAVPLANAEDLKNKQKHVQHQVKSAQHDLGESSAELRQATARLDAARAGLSRAKTVLRGVRDRLGDARVRDHKMKVRLAAAVLRLETAQADLENGRVALEEQRVVVTNVITSIYQQGDPELLAFAALLDAQTTADLTRQMEARDVIVGRESRTYDDLRAAEVLLEVSEQLVQDAKDDVAVQQREAAEHLVTMKVLTQRARQARATVLALVQDRRQARQASIKARKHDRVLLANLERQEQRIRQEILERARRAARMAARKSGGGGYRGQTDGYLNRPVGGIVTSPFGYRTHPIYRYWGLHDGTDFRAGCGQGLFASAGGVVISRYYSPVWGNRLHLSLGQVNGKNLTVVYNHLSGYRVGDGQRVGRGEVVGYAGTTGWSTACHLHFTVLVNGSPVDPMNWF